MPGRGTRSIGITLALTAALAAPAGASVVNPDISLIGQPVARWTDAAGDADVEEAYFSLLRGLPAGLALKGGKYRVGFGKLNPLHHGQQHLISRRLGNSASTPEISPAFLRMTVNGIQDAAGPLRPSYYQEAPCA